MTYCEQDELALLLMMVESSGGGNRHTATTAGESVAEMLYEPEEADAWYVSPGSGHLPAELGGRIAEEAPPPTADTRRRGDLLREYGLGECLSELSPLQFDHKTLTYTGTIFWDSQEMGGIRL